MAKRTHTREFKAKVALEALRGEETMASLAQKHGLHPGQIQNWKSLVLEGTPALFGGLKKAGNQEKDNTSELERKIGQLVVENDFLKKKLGNFPKTRGGK